jgi:hypothetical protein
VEPVLDELTLTIVKFLISNPVENFVKNAWNEKIDDWIFFRLKVRFNKLKVRLVLLRISDFINQSSLIKRLCLYLEQ